MADPLDSPKSLLSFAREDIRKLNPEFEAFFNSNPYTYVVHHDPQSGHDFHRLTSFTAMAYLGQALTQLGPSGLSSQKSHLMTLVRVCLSGFKTP